MSKKIIIITLLIILVIILGAAIYYAMQHGSTPTPGNNQPNNPVSQNTAPQPQHKVPTVAEQVAQINKDYPETITGTINFLDKGINYKTTITADGGKEYIVSPPQSESIYKSMGLKDGQRVEVQGKINDQGNLILGTLKPI
jgi:uncharacterized protein YdeI (BOF family)